MYVATEAAPADAILTVTDLAATIVKREVLTAVSFAVRPGEALGVVGETGSGKTLSCRAVMGLLPRLGGRITAGSIVFDGDDVATYSERQWHRLRGRRWRSYPRARCRASTR